MLLTIDRAYLGQKIIKINRPHARTHTRHTRHTRQQSKPLAQTQSEQRRNTAPSGECKKGGSALARARRSRKRTLPPPPPSHLPYYIALFSGTRLNPKPSGHNFISICHSCGETKKNFLSLKKKEEAIMRSAFVV